MGAYAPSKFFQILSTYKLKNDLFGKNEFNLEINKFFCY
jgi:hypothetical protein